MATNTPNYNLEKPDGSDAPDISVINSNMDKIDSQMKTTSDVLTEKLGRVDVWNKLTLLWDKGGTWGSRAAVFDLNTKVLHLNFQIVSVPSGIGANEGVPILEIPYPSYGNVNQYPALVGFSTGQLIWSTTTNVLSVFSHSANPSIIRCSMSIVLADNAVP